VLVLVQVLLGLLEIHDAPADARLRKEYQWDQLELLYFRQLRQVMR
jgi:hypothetical protein